MSDGNFPARAVGVILQAGLFRRDYPVAGGTSNQQCQLIEKVRLGKLTALGWALDTNTFNEPK